MTQSEIEEPVLQTFLGLHLAGPNSEKSAIVALKKIHIIAMLYWKRMKR